MCVLRAVAVLRPQHGLLRMQITIHVLTGHYSTCILAATSCRRCCCRCRRRCCCCQASDCHRCQDGLQEKPGAGEFASNQQQRATQRPSGTQLHTGQQKAAGRKHAPLDDPLADMESSEEESSEDDDEKDRALQEEQDMQDRNGEDEEDEPARPKR